MSLMLSLTLSLHPWRLSLYATVYLSSLSVFYSIYSSHIVADSLFIEVFILTIIFVLEIE